MAKHEARFRGRLDEFLNQLHSKLRAEKVNESEYRSGQVRVMVQVYEKYSFWNRGWISLTILLTESEGELFISAISSGGNGVAEGAQRKLLEQVVTIIEAYLATN